MDIDGSQEESHRQVSPGTLCETQLYKRPIITFNKEYNDIYITNKVPLCVYHKRAVDLLRWQLSKFGQTTSADNLAKYNVNSKTGQLRNKSIILSSEDLMQDSKAITMTMTKRNLTSRELTKKGITIYAAGTCIKRAFYLLQDIYDYLGTMYLDGKSRFSGTLRIYCQDCRQKMKQEGRKRDRDVKNDCIKCKLELNKKLEALIKSLFDIEITSGSITCIDDIWKFQSNIKLDLSNFQVPSPFVNTNLNMSSFERKRIISSIKIAINLKEAQ